ncbi:MAG: hypothetical protein WC982_04300 [Advenella sp.]
MLKKCSCLKWMSLPLLTAFAVVTGLAVANNATAEPVAGFVHMSISGNWYPKPAKNHINWYHVNSALMISPGLSVPEPENADPGGVAAFGWFDSGEIQLLAYAEYIPAVQSGRLSRKFTPSARIQLQALPRYVMMCSWVTEDGHPTGTRHVGYGEREDANAIDEFSATVRYHPLSVRWANVPAKRVESKFSDRDYCDEISRTKTSSAPMWLPDKKLK